jgi:RNA polymerase sigma-32 factor
MISISGSIDQSPESRSWMRCIHHFPMLSAEREDELARRWRNDADQAALAELVTSHLRLVVKMARTLRNYGLPTADLIAEGSIGMIKAVHRFNPDHGARLATYAMPWIRAEMYEYIIRSWSVVGAGRTKSLRKLFFNLPRIKRELEPGATGELAPETVRRIASRLHVAEADIAHMDRRLGAADVSLNRKMVDDGSLSLQDAIVDDRDDPETQLGNVEEMTVRRRLMKDAMATLSERERFVLEARRLRDPPASLDELADRFAVSCQRIGQLERGAIMKLRAKIADERRSPFRRRVAPRLPLASDHHAPLVERVGEAAFDRDAAADREEVMCSSY